MVVRRVCLGTLLALVAGCGGPTVLSSAPGGGGLAAGESVLVDDGRCPTGQVSRVTGAATLTGPRQYDCAPKPK